MTTLLITTFCLGCCVGMTFTYIAYRVIERKHRKKDGNTQTPDRKKLVYGRQKTRDKYIVQYQDKGWRLRMTQTDYWKNGKVVYIAELEKESP